ncbi:MAG: hypothetical protein EBR32_03640 [Bacteroidetes bacterium]|nr:hypothetical protein [Bacteroidota bacterium]
MKTLKVGIGFGVMILALIACETPQQPDFTTSQKIEAPLLTNKTLQFLGGGGDVEVLIDTTKAEFDSVFTVTQSGPDAGFLTISKTESFDFGDLNDAIPEISAEGTEFSAEVGELSLGSFSSGNGALGEANFQDLTGLNPAVVPIGTPLFGATSPIVNIAVGANTDFFSSATIKRGAILVDLTNDLGFNINQLNLTLKSGDTDVSTTTVTSFNAGTDRTATLSFNPGDVLSDINIDVSMSWNTQNTSAVPTALIVQAINGVDLVASEVVAALEAQDFSTTSTSSFDATEFQFTSADHYVELASGSIEIAPIVNGLDLTIEELVISFPTIRKEPYGLGDSLVIEYKDATKVLRSAESIAQSIDLSGYRLYALNNEVTYTTRAVTENTQDAAPGDQNRVISETMSISSSVAIENLKIAEAFGEVKPQTVLLGDDDPLNGVEIIDIMNDAETELTEIDGLEDLSKQLDGLEFTRAKLSIDYTSNIGIPTTIYAAIMGVDGDGEEFFLTGINGSDKQVLDSDNISGLLKNGEALGTDQLIKFSLDTPPSGQTLTSSIEFNGDNSTVVDFLNNLPNEIRFIGKAIINEDGEAATISTPLEFSPSFAVDLPLAFQTTTAATFSDTTETDALENLPSPDDEGGLTIKGGQVIINYENGLPLGFGLDLEFLDASNSTITTIPLTNEDPIQLNAAGVDAVTRYVSTPAISSTILSLSKAQFDELHKTKSVVISARLNSSNNEEVKIKTTDYISLSISVSLEMETTVGGN